MARDFKSGVEFYKGEMMAAVGVIRDVAEEIGGMGIVADEVSCNSLIMVSNQLKMVLDAMKWAHAVLGSQRGQAPCTPDQIVYMDRNDVERIFHEEMEKMLGRLEGMEFGKTRED